MLPNIDITTYTGVNMNTTPTQSPTRRSDDDQLVQEAYRSSQDQRNRPGAAEGREKTDAEAAQEVNATESATKARNQVRPGTKSYEKGTLRDKAEINFQLTMEERDVFLNAMSGKEEPSMMTRDEQSTLQRVSERIEKLIEEAESKSSDRVDRVEGAIKEWYNRLSNGKYKAPTDLIQLIRLAATGSSDLSKIEL